MEGAEIKSNEFWTTLIVFTVVIVAFFLFSYYTLGLNKNKVYDVEEDVLFSGISFDLESGSAIKLNLDGREYLLEIDSLLEDEVNFSLEDFGFFMNVNNSVEFSLDKNFKLKIDLEGIENEKANFSLVLATVDACEPNWVCSDWGPCFEGLSKRVCVDGNYCGLEDGNPEMEEIC